MFITTNTYGSGIKILQKNNEPNNLKQTENNKDKEYFYVDIRTSTPQGSQLPICRIRMVFLLFNRRLRKSIAYLRSIVSGLSNHYYNGCLVCGKAECRMIEFGRPNRITEGIAVSPGGKVTQIPISKTDKLEEAIIGLPAEAFVGNYEKPGNLFFVQNDYNYGPGLSVNLVPVPEMAENLVTIGEMARIYCSYGDKHLNKMDDVFSLLKENLAFFNRSGTPLCISGCGVISSGETPEPFGTYDIIRDARYVKARIVMEKKARKEKEILYTLGKNEELTKKAYASPNQIHRLARFVYSNVDKNTNESNNESGEKVVFNEWLAKKYQSTGGKYILEEKSFKEEQILEKDEASTFTNFSIVDNNNNNNNNNNISVDSITHSSSINSNQSSKNSSPKLQQKSIKVLKTHAFVTDAPTETTDESDVISLKSVKNLELNDEGDVMDFVITAAENVERINVDSIDLDNKFCFTPMGSKLSLTNLSNDSNKVKDINTIREENSDYTNIHTRPNVCSRLKTHINDYEQEKNLSLDNYNIDSETINNTNEVIDPEANFSVTDEIIIAEDFKDSYSAMNALRKINVENIDSASNIHEASFDSNSSNKQSSNNVVSKKFTLETKDLEIPVPSPLAKAECGPESVRSQYTYKMAKAQDAQTVEQNEVAAQDFIDNHLYKDGIRPGSGMRYRYGREMLDVIGNTKAAPDLSTMSITGDTTDNKLVNSSSSLSTSSNVNYHNKSEIKNCSDIENSTCATFDEEDFLTIQSNMIPQNLLVTENIQNQNVPHQFSVINQKDRSMMMADFMNALNKDKTNSSFSKRADISRTFSTEEMSESSTFWEDEK